MKKMETILANLPMALCLLLGMGLIIVEVFLPGFGLPGVAGIALVGVGTIMAADALRHADGGRAAAGDYRGAGSADFVAAPLGGRRRHG